ncbi:MAG: hypothetical protein HWD61_06000 [Parachlamydiaceae bacterium]|nr:MAG: hypothetical protein HWD61_06000 [Parachlamydiaceae bacterium]
MPRIALLKWHDADLKKKRDMLIGLCSICFYPFILLSVLIVGIFGQQSSSGWKKCSIGWLFHHYASLNVKVTIALLAIRKHDEQVIRYGSS